MKIKVEHVPPYDGEYPLVMEHLTNRDIHTIKRIAGYTPIEYGEAGRREDTDFLLALAVVACQHSGRHPSVHEEAFWNARLGGISVLVDDEEEGDGDPPTSEAGTPSTPSGAPSTSGSEPAPESPPPSTGPASSAT